MNHNNFEIGVINRLNDIIASGCGGTTILPITYNTSMREEVFRALVISTLDELALAGCGSSIDLIKLELQLTDTLVRYKEFFYDVNGNLETIEIWNSPLKTIQYFNMEYTYTGDNLTGIEVKRISDNYIYNKELTYDINNNLTSIDITLPV